MNQSRPRRLPLDGTLVAASTAPASVRTTGSSQSDGPRSMAWGSRCWGDDGRANICPPISLMIKLPWLKAAGSAENHDRRVFLVFRRRHDLFLGQFKRDAVALVGDAAKMQRIPIDNDLPAADAEKTAEVDDGGAHRAQAVDDHIDDTPHVFFGGAPDIPPKHAARFAGADDGDGWRRRRFLHRRRSPLLWRRSGRGCFAFPPRIRAVQADGDDGREREQIFGAHLIPSLEDGSQISAIRLSRDQRESTMETWICPRVFITSSETSLPCRLTRRSALETPSCRSRSTTSLRKAGRRGLCSRISRRSAANSRPSAASSKVNGVALAQACGAQATG